MEFDIAKSKIRKLSERFNLLLLLVLALLIANIILAGGVVWLATTRAQTIVPANMTTAVTVSGNRVDASYLEQLSINFIVERLNVTPETVDQNHGFILEYTAPELYHELNDILLKEATAIKEGKISSVFYISEIRVDPSHLKVMIKGVLKRWVGDRALEPEQKTYLIQYNYHLGTPKIMSFTEVKGEEHE